MTSFVKLRKEDTAEIAGVRTSIRNGKVCSSGNSSLDFVIGGGIELNSIVLIGEDKYGRYSNVITKLFLADCVHFKHACYFANLDEDPHQLIRDIPPPSEHQAEQPEAVTDNDLRIAFRYQDLPKIDSVQRGSQAGVTYDLSKKYDKEKTFENVNFLSFSDCQQRRSETNQSAFDIIIQDLAKLVKESSGNLLRICISSLGSPLWYSQSLPEDLLRFLVQLKSIVRYNENVVCLLTMPLHLIQLIDDQLCFRIRKLVDCNINLESFDDVDKQTNAVFKQYHGLLHVKKLQTIHALHSHKPEAFDLAFKLKSNRFLIEKLHLPPELQDPREEPSMSCATSGGNRSNKLDF